MNYLPLNIKTDNSLQKSLISVNELIMYAKANNIKSLTITDNNMYGVMDFYKLCIKNDIKPVIGLEVTLDDLQFILYAINYNGYKNLLRISTLMSDNPLTINDIERFSQDLICLVPYTSINVYDKLNKIYKEIFMTYKNQTECDIINTKKVYMNEILYLDRKDSKYIKYLNAMRDNVIVQLALDNPNAYFDHLSEAVKYGDIDNNKYICDLCNVEIPFNQDLMPLYISSDNTDSYTYLKKKCIEGLKRLFGNQIGSKYQERLKYELDVINKMGFNDYFLIVYDYVNYARTHNIIVGPGRGSAVGSLVAYVLGITDVDPLKYDLLFERFLNVERISMPDIDIDFEHTKREEIIRYCISKYGEKSVAPIITFGTMGSKQAIRDVGKTMDIELKLIDGLCKQLDSRLTLKENLEKTKVINYIKRYDNLEALYDIATRFEGLKKHTSIHAAGIVMSKYPLDEVIPLSKNHDLYISGYDMKYLEEIGLLKMDFLAIKYLTIIHKIIDDINEKNHTNLTFDNIPDNDAKALSIFTSGNTLGIFQFESEGMISFLKRLKAESFDDVCAAIALYRPGPMKNIPEYIRRKNDAKKIDYLDVSLEPILKSTYGIMIYQEQIMQIATVMADYTLGEADILRKAMSKKIKELLLTEEKRFTTRSIKKGYPSDVVKKVYGLMLKFAEYGFNKSHSVGYALVSYRMAYLKAHYPRIFMANLLSIESSDILKVKKYIYEARSNGISILMPDINLSGFDYIDSELGVRYPLTNIKNVGITAAQTIIKERLNGPYQDIYDFIKRCYGKSVNKKTIESLIEAGVFNSLGLNRHTLIDNLDAIINYGELIKDLDPEYALKPVIKFVEEYSKKEIMAMELDIFGLYLSNNPVTEYKQKYENIINLCDLDTHFDSVISTIVLVDRVKEINTKNNKKMCFITGSDEVDTIDITLFPDIYSKYNDIEVGSILYIKGKVEKRFDKLQIIVSEIMKLMS